MFEDRLTERAKIAINNAAEAAMELGHNYVGTEHLLVGLIREGDGVAGKILEANGLTDDKVIDLIAEMIGTGAPIDNIQPEATPRTKRVFEHSYIEARRLGHNYIGTEHLLIALLRESESVAVRILVELGVQPQTLYNDIIRLLNENAAEEGAPDGMPHGDGHSRGSKGGNTPTLMKFGRDLTQLAREDKLDPVIGRDEEIERVVQILSRRTKNNPCLIGEPGVGKTAVAEGLAEKIVSGRIPEILKNKKVIALDMSSMIAGAKYRGEFEERLKKAMEEIHKAGNIILFMNFQLHRNGGFPSVSADKS